ncbi:BTB/POZ AND TAZ DOMAIN-CONTAINING PROTEIN 4 [Salix viminalis]|uniref:BTB/POZ AND TAZ DOMAIN-CONTAINING PROTEIN 4 n=1 Tax=Salix viminalis TaxID=40686 RepID=A0A9Q0NJ87_SALVM|nr:BTB/POZ AND TAZ DOMAIN-CONTAINING PROTEIN 4 [Salix viminalis]
MEDCVLHLLVLSHVFVVPSLKQICIQQLEHGFLTSENVVDIVQLALLCDAPGLATFVIAMIPKNFREISMTEGWKVMKKSATQTTGKRHRWCPWLMKKICKGRELEDQRRERSISNYTKQWRLLFIYARDGCRTIGPHDKAFPRDNRAPLQLFSMQRTRNDCPPFCKLQVKSTWWLHPLQENVATAGTTLPSLC